MGAAAAGFAVFALASASIGRLTRRTATPWDEKILARLAPAGRALFPLLAVRICLPAARLSPHIQNVFGHLLNLLCIAAFASLLVSSIRVMCEILLSRYDLERSDNLSARKVHTQIRVLEKALLSIVSGAALAFMLMTFPGIRQIGISLLASAGIAGIILGLAAQKTIGTLLAGLQIAVTQPIRLDDVVIVEGEWGRIEEINLTYVVVRIWDLRRLVVPIQHFIDKPFQNWTRASSELLGSVFLYLDYSAPVELIRRELESITKAAPLWDGKTCNLQVTECKEQTVELRILVSAASASDAWDLRCHVRERLLEYVRKNHPESFPRFRTTLLAPGPVEAAPSH
ncbi:MAG TPA: mechanosensitive ion channel domain-containing protein [Fibrobacteria bacterium]|nr:mechanosensitive ion channel domain-containing protein [Fibrobacteria bacterium]